MEKTVSLSVSFFFFTLIFKVWVISLYKVHVHFTFSYGCDCATMASRKLLEKNEIHSFLQYFPFYKMHLCKPFQILYLST